VRSASYQQNSGAVLKARYITSLLSRLTVNSVIQASFKQQRVREKCNTPTAVRAHTHMHKGDVLKK